MKDLPRNLLILATAVMLLALVGGCGDPTRTIEVGEAWKAITVFITLSSILAFVVGIIVGMRMEAVDTKCWKKIADSRSGEGARLRGQLRELKKQLKRIAKDL